MIWLRVAIVAAVVLGVWLALRWHERRATVSEGVGPGLTLVTAEGCVLCGPALEALRRVGPSVHIRVVDAAEMPGQIRSVPTALAVDDDGTVLMQRSGRSVITDARLLVTSVAPALTANTD